MRTIADIKVNNTGITLNGKSVATEGEGKEMLSHAYRSYVNDYPKFFKMDGLSRLGFLCSELLLNATDEERFVERDDRAIILFNRSGSADTDRRYEETIRSKENYFPSPSIFVYTLPNIVTGEIAIRNKYLGETSFYLLDHRDDETMARIVRTAFADPATKSVLTGWIEYTNDDRFEAEMRLIKND